jgi:hypothetical protein
LKKDIGSAFFDRILEAVRVILLNVCMFGLYIPLFEFEFEFEFEWETEEA